MSKNSHDHDVAFIQALAELLSANDLAEIEVTRDYDENDSLSVRVSRVAMVAPVSMPAPAATAAAPVMPAAAPAPVAAAVATDDPASHPGAVNSPMVGTVYLQGEPGAPPFVKVGDTVAQGDTVLIIEAMKTMNQIPSPRAGTVRRILVGDGDPVEYGAPLMIID